VSLQRDKRLESTSLTDEPIEELTDSLLTEFGIRDYFDRQIYSTTAHLKCILLTEGGSLHKLYRRAENTLPKPKGMGKWKDVLP
jgi:hypothetical protein